MTALLSFVLAAMNAVAPGRDHAVLAEATADVVDAADALFADDADKRKTASFVIAVEDRESSLDNGAIGDSGQSHCAGQVYLPGNARTREGWTGADLRADAHKCITVVVRKIRESFAACRSLPLDERLSGYARGSCTSVEGRRISRDRATRARWIFAHAIEGAS